MLTPRLSWRPSRPGIASALALLLGIAPAPAAEPDPPKEPATRLGVKGTEFTLNGRPTFLYGLSYYGGLGAPEEAIRKDLADAKKHGFNWLRVWATWGAFENDVSAVDAEGKPREDYLKKLKWLVAECDRQGFVVDVNRAELESFCDEFKRTQTFRPGDYPTRWHKSYTLVLIRALLGQLKEPTTERVPRSRGMILTAYFLAKYSRLGGKIAGNYPPPVETGCATWEQVYRQVYAQLNHGRTPEQFKQSIAGSIKGIGTKLRERRALDPKETEAVKEWVGESREALWNEVKKYFDGIPADPPRITRLKAKFKELHPLPVPPRPQMLRRLRRIMTVYERPSAITRYVKRTRGTCCQLCGQEFFFKRNGLRYSEVHHIFQLSKNPPPECLSPEYLVSVCANCHRMLHYAETGEPTPVDGGWEIRVGTKTHRFSTRPK